MDSGPLDGFALAASAVQPSGGMFGSDYFDIGYFDESFFSSAIVSAPTPPPPTTAGVQLFREALEARLLSSTDLAAYVGDRIFYGVLPQKLDLGRDGPALTFLVIGRPTGKILTGSDGTATARVQFSAWGYREREADRITEVIRNMFDGPQPAWGNGTLIVTGCYQEDEVDLPEEPRSGSDQWTYQIASDYSIKHRVSIPTLS